MIKKFLVFGGLALLASSGFAQRKPAAKPMLSKATNNDSIPVLKTMTDSASYALGLNIAQSLKKNLGDLKPSLILQAMKNEFAGKIPFLDEAVTYSVLNKYSAQAKEKEAQATIDEGRAFLATNKTKSGIITTASGLQYEVLKKGTGAIPAAEDTVTVHYRGTLLNGHEFDASYNRNEPLTLPLSSVIKGWIQGVQLMTVGSKYKFDIPYELGYGLRGAPPSIPGGSILIFEIELLSIKKAG